MAALEKKIKENEVKFNDKAWDSISENCKDFLRLCFVKDKHSRCQIEDLVDHDWIKSNAPGIMVKETFTNIANRLAAFKKTNTF